MWNLKYDTNEPIYEKQTDSQREQTCDCQEGRTEWGRKGLGSSGLADANYYM